MTAQIVQFTDGKPRVPFSDEFDGDFQTSFWHSYSDRMFCVLWDLVSDGKRRDG